MFLGYRRPLHCGRHPQGSVRKPSRLLSAPRQSIKLDQGLFECALATVMSTLDLTAARGDLDNSSDYQVDNYNDDIKII